MKTQRSFYFPTVPYNIIDSINRAAAATGTIRYAQQSSHANYNGHAIHFVSPNPFRNYWRAYYYWGEFVYLCRGSLADCIRAAKTYLDRGAKGASVTLVVDNDADAQIALDAGMTEGKDPEAWRTDLHAEAFEALKWERTFGVPTSLYIESTTKAEWHAKREAYLKASKSA
jgi:hypothetical protein